MKPLAAGAMMRVLFFALVDAFRTNLGGDEPDREAIRVWRDALRRCGVDNVVEKRPAVFKARRLEGVRVPFTVVITPSGAAGSLEAEVRVGGAPAVVSLQRESIKVRARRIAGASEQVLGDAEFDRTFFVVGDPVVVRAIFDGPARARALRVFGRTRSTVRELLVGDDDLQVGIADGTLVAQVEDSRFEITPASFLADMLALAERITDADAEERLAEIARADTQPAVRRCALETLRDRRTGHAATIAALEAACADADPRVRLMAAAAIGIARGRDALIALAEAPDVPDDVSAGAVEGLRSHLPAERALAILERSLASRHRTAAACLDTLSRLGPHGDAAARVLDEMPSAEVGIAAANALRRCGTAAHVELLLEVGAASRGEPLGDACRAAVASIQSRQLGASAGQVSLADGEAGRLSVATDESGRLSLGAAQPAGPREDS